MKADSFTSIYIFGNYKYRHMTKSSEKIKNQPSGEFDRAGNRKIKWIKFLTGTMKYITILPITALVIAPMIIYLAPIAFAGIILVLTLTGNSFLVQFNIISWFIPLLLIGALEFLIGLIIAIGGGAQIVKHRFHKEEKLVQTRFYYNIRHPQSVGLILCVLGMVTALFGFSGVLGVWGFFFVFYFSMRMEAYIEEYFLIRKYQDEYIDYMKYTGLFLPKNLNRPETKNLGALNLKKYIRQGLLYNFLGMVLALSLLFLGCRLYLHFSSAALPEMIISWENIFNLNRTEAFYPDGYIINEIISVSPLFIFWGYMLVGLFTKGRKIEDDQIS